MPFTCRVSENPGIQTIAEEPKCCFLTKTQKTKNTNITNKSFENALRFKHAYMWTTQLYSRREEQIKYQENL